ncbi:hypothetical protein NED98_00225 [Sphingomonas sp. MMSM20]|uniref:hypothetical protein n=1 Tax=Sphingomonas lycopersici TaxID=2951807 RepID=UPI0022389629|nr:hypothetical protein [Sphingomonas lycopersici]MCW6528655.1 hypothetical protein [Sphingomonas lycopersici]
MVDAIIDPAIEGFIADVVNIGSAYDLAGMERLYTADQTFLILSGEGEVTRFTREEVFSEFRSRRDAGEAPLSTEYRILHVERQGDDAVALLYRRMSPEAPPVMYELRLRHQSGTWAVRGETVTPWPGAAGGAFLPPRKMVA